MRAMIFILSPSWDSHEVCTDLRELLIDIRRNTLG
jgi:hypothetical protein